MIETDNHLLAAWYRWALLSLLLGLSGCAVGPDYQRPDQHVPATYKSNTQWKLAQPADMLPKETWWKVYQDPQLNQFMAILNRQNPSIVKAKAQYRQAAAVLHQAQALLLPSIATTVGKTRGPGSAEQPIVNSYDVSVSASWEVDLWGSLGRAVDANQAKLQASAAQLDAMRLSMQGQLATAYLQLAITDQQLKTLTESERTLQHLLQLTQNQYRAGIIDQTHVVQINNQLKALQAQRANQQQSRNQFEHAIAVLLDQSPAELTIEPAAHLPKLPILAADIPSALLERRPDIATAERNMAAANAEIGLAQAAFFPKLTLSARIGYRGSSFAQWINLPNRIWSVGPELALTLFDAGQRTAIKEQAIANYDISVATYRQTVLAAFQNVEDTLSAQQLLMEEAGYQNEALKGVQRTEAIISNQYQAGTQSYLASLTTQNNRLTQQNIVLGVYNQQIANSVALVLALGGAP